MTCLLIALTGAELYVQGLHRVLPLANNIVIFAIVNLNIILLLALVLLVLRNLVKLYYERRGKIIGSRFRTKLVIAFFGLSLTPCVLLVLVASGLITKSFNNWFNVSIERSLEDSLEVSRNYYRLIEQDALHFGEQLRTVLLGKLICYGTTERQRWQSFRGEAPGVSIERAPGLRRQPSGN